MNMELALQTFFDESRELLTDMERILLQLESFPGDAELRNALFRCVHTVKGSAGIFGFQHVVSFTHVVENVLDRLRTEEIHLSQLLADLLLRCRDHISLLVDIADPEDAVRLASASQRLLTELGPFHSVTPPQTPQAVVADSHQQHQWRLSVQIAADALRFGMDPLGFIGYLSRLGQLQVTTSSQAVPCLAELEPESCYLSFELALTTDASEALIKEAFELGNDLYQVQLECVQSAQLAKLSAGPPNDSSPELLARTIDKDAGQAHRRKPPAQHFRVQADKLDRLINLVGELVIASASVSLNAGHSGDAVSRESAANLNLLVEDIRNSSLELRMVAIGETFQRFQRVVRDLSAEIGKDIQLDITGAETELDKTVVEKIGDPLMHLVRNACDHGIELPAVRQQKGKLAQGLVQLNAYHESGAIVIEVNDDGNGLNRQKILAKAKEKHLLTGDGHLSDSEVFNLIFEPGFSTVEQVTNLSGRGVGMDVVKRNIEALRGSVELISPGTLGGTTFRIRLPLTLAIIDGFLARVGDATYVVPLDLVVECTELPKALCNADVVSTSHYINLRDEVLPIILLREHFMQPGTSGRRQNIIVVRHGAHKVGLVVDELLGEQQTVIKPLSGIFSHVKGLSGSTILGSGQVSLILDVPALLQQVSQREDSLDRSNNRHVRAPLAAC
ncbi:chemotaxis protein CheA [Alishewanella longhuensis]|uniref:Chemotaxis protein CheA n=1 Tax=Alishewanella longhuensis TaxID=1091037 RepID=A0ABQ3KVU1_9ALTE|nr:chemotaxis protein CheA [Alishewanella longhuensis]GHG63408.1 chemotaxis protein CheA [Alishewanella longhuensis]